MITMQSLPARSLRVALGAATLGGFGLLTTLGAGVANAAQSAAPTSASAGYVYLNDNTTGTNTIAAFARHADGSLTPLAGSPFVAGGAGTGASGLASQGALQLTNDGRFLIAVDAGSNQISVLRVENDGSLKLLPGAVVSSHGALPVSIGVHDSLVYVANAGPADSNYTGFTLSPSGRLSPLADSTVSLPSASQPGDVVFNSTGTNLVGTRVGTSQIDTFSVGSDGLLTAAADSPLAAQAAGPFGSKFSPIDPSQLFVSNAHAGAGAGSVSSFSVANDGTLSSVGALPVANGQSGTCWVEITHDGQFLFSVNTGSGTISRYSIAPGGALTLIGSTPVSQQGGVGATDLRLSPDGKTLYVDESRIGQVGVFAVNGSNLTELSSVALPASAGAAGVAVSS
jgi:6-phosphogluconolactonase (cycloisomerase 2 family)